jgi:cold shock CspA family protein
MAKSQQSFNKKEKEKKKLQKRQDKEQKKEDRKAHSDKGKGIEEMLAYVDENGNITSSPPDTRRRMVIEPENIQIGVPKQAPPDPEDAIRRGIVTFFNDSKGYGFIRDQETQQSIFVHSTGLLNPIKEKDKVTFEVKNGPKGPGAVNVKIA